MKAIGIIGVVVLAVTLVLCGCTQGNDNAEFLKWMQGDIDYTLGTYDKLVNEKGSSEWYNLKVVAEEAEDYVATVSAPKCASFEVSGDYIPLKDEYSDYLSDMSLVYSYMKSFGRDMLYGHLDDASEAIGNANDYVRKSTVHTDAIYVMLDKILRDL